MPRHLPAEMDPTFLNRLRHHVKDVAVAVISVVIGVLVNLGASSAEMLVRLPLWYMPNYLVHGLGAMVAAGGVFSLVGLLVTRKRLDPELRTEQTGEILLFFGWGTFAYATARYADFEYGSIILGVVFSLASLGRFLVLDRIERHERAKRRAEGREG